jgi:hypothetical protein
MTSTTHPRVFARGTRIKTPETITQAIPRTVLHVIVYAPTPERKQWVENELGLDATIQVAHSIKELVSTLVEDSRARPQILVIDLDPLSAGELFHLHQIREHGWCGTIIALGLVPASLRSSLQITRVIRSYLDRAIADELVKYRCATEERTMPITVVRDEPRDHRTFG